MYQVLDIQGSRDSGVNKIAVGPLLEEIREAMIQSIQFRIEIKTIYSHHNSYRSDKNIC